MDEKGEHSANSAKLNGSNHANGQSSSFFGTPAAEKQDKNQLFLYLHTFKDARTATQSVPLSTRAQLTDSIKSSSSTSQDFIIYWPLCTHNNLYEDPKSFLKVLTGVKSKLKGKSLHFVFVDTGELERHNIAKRGVSPSSSVTQLAKTSQLPDTSTVVANTTPVKIPVTQQNEKSRELGVQAGKKLIGLLDIKKITQTLNCKASLLDWQQIKDPVKFRAQFKETIGSTAEDPKWFQQYCQDNDIHQLANFVEEQYEANDKDLLTDPPNFTIATSSILTEQNNKDYHEFGIGRYNIERSLKYNKAYLWEEVSHMMLVRFSVGDLINVVMQPETLPKKHSPRRRLLCVGEVLNEWVFKLLSLKLGIDFINMPGLYQYVTVGMYPEYLQKQDKHTNDVQTAPASPIHVKSVKPADTVSKTADTDSDQKPNSPPATLTRTQKLLADIYSNGTELQSLPLEDQQLMAFILQGQLEKLKSVMSTNQSTPTQVKTVRMDNMDDTDDMDDMETGSKSAKLF